MNAPSKQRKEYDKICENIEALCDQLKRIKKEGGDPTEIFEQLEIWLNRYMKLRKNLKKSREAFCY